MYAWITVNYLLGKIGSSDKKATVGIMDLGVYQIITQGGSTQIVFEPTSSKMDDVFALDFNQHTYKLHQHSYDGYGLMQARKKIIGGSKNDAPCIPLGKSHQSEGEITGTGTAFSSCELFISANIFNKTCALDTCSFDGIYMPPIDPSTELYAFSYFYDKFAEQFEKTLGFIVGDIKTAAATVCIPNPVLSPIARLENESNDAWCIDLGMFDLM